MTRKQAWIFYLTLKWEKYMGNEKWKGKGKNPPGLLYCFGFLIVTPGSVLLLKTGRGQIKSQVFPLFTHQRIISVNGCFRRGQMAFSWCSSKWVLSSLCGWKSNPLVFSVCQTSGHAGSSRMGSWSCQAHPHLHGKPCEVQLKVRLRACSGFPALVLAGSSPQQTCTSLSGANEIAVSVSQGVLRSLIH